MRGRRRGYCHVGQAERVRRTSGIGFPLCGPVKTAIHRHVGHAPPAPSFPVHAGVDTRKISQVDDSFRLSQGAQKMSAPEKSLLARLLGALAEAPSTGLSTGSVDDSILAAWPAGDVEAAFRSDYISPRCSRVFAPWSRGFGAGTYTFSNIPSLQWLGVGACARGPVSTLSLVESTDAG